MDNPNLLPCAANPSFMDGVLTDSLNGRKNWNLPEKLVITPEVTQEATKKWINYSVK